MRRLTKDQFVDRTLVRWQTKFPITRRVAARDAELVRFVYEELRSENYSNAFPDAEPTPIRRHRPTSDGLPREDER